MPDFSYLIGGLITAILVLWMLYVRYLSPKASQSRNRIWHYTSVPTQTPTELKFFKLLNSVFPEMTIAPQVALSALARVDAKKTRAENQRAAISHIARKRVDYVLFETLTGRVHCVIELDDYSHDAPGMRAKDRDRDDILRSAGHKVFRFDVRNGLTGSHLRTTIDKGTC